MSKLVSMQVSDESYEAALYIARMARKDTTWVYQQWATFAKDEAVNSNDGLRQHLQNWRNEELRAFQRRLELPGIEADEDPPF